MNHILNFQPEPYQPEAESEDAFQEYAGEFDEEELANEFEFRSKRRSRCGFPQFKTQGQKKRHSAKANFSKVSKTVYPPSGIKISPVLPGIRPIPRIRFPFISVASRWPVYPLPDGSIEKLQPRSNGSSGGEPGSGQEPSDEPAGSSSDYVRWVQNCLNQVMGLRLPLEGVMDAATRSAIRSFQDRQGLPVDGLVGPSMEEALRQTCGSGGIAVSDKDSTDGWKLESLETLSSGNHGEQDWEDETNQSRTDFIRWVQKSLNKILGTRLSLDGILGKNTRSAIRNLQQQRGLRVDGLVGPETERALRTAGFTQPSVNATPIRSVPASDKMPQGPFGVLTISEPAPLRYSYAFTPEDVLWTARFIVGEAGGRNDADNHAVIWAMFNRYALFTHKHFKTFHSFLRAYSTPLQAVLHSWGAAKRHMHKPEFVRTGEFYPPPAPPGIPKGQLQRFRKLQETPWHQLPASARSLAEQALKGLIENPIGNASEFASTFVYYRDKYGKNPNDENWRKFTESHARNKGWIWIGPIQGLNQKKNAFFIQKRVNSLPKNTVRVINSLLQREFGNVSFWPNRRFSFSEVDNPTDLFEAEFNFYDFPENVLKLLRNGMENAAVKLAINFGITDVNKLTNLVFFARHPERQGRKLKKAEPSFKELSREWTSIQNNLVRPSLTARKTTLKNPPKTSLPIKYGVPGGQIGSQFNEWREMKYKGKVIYKGYHRGIDVSPSKAKGGGAEDPRRGLPVFLTLKPVIEAKDLNTVSVSYNKEEPLKKGLGIPSRSPAVLEQAKVIRIYTHKEPDNAYGGWVSISCIYKYQKTDGSIGRFTLYIEYLHLITKDTLPYDGDGSKISTESWLAAGNSQKLGFGPEMIKGKTFTPAQLTGKPLLIGYLGTTRWPHVHIQVGFKPGVAESASSPRVDPTVMIK